VIVPLGGTSGTSAPSIGGSRVDPMPAMVGLNLYYCAKEGGHLVKKNPCPKHHTPTTPYGDEPV